MHSIDPFGKDDLAQLRAVRDAHCVSIYLPTHRKGPEVQQNPIRLKNLLIRAEETLKSHGARWDTIEAVLGESKALLDNEFFWQHQADGLAIFARPYETKIWRTGIRFAESVTVNDRFDLAQMMRLLATDGHFYILSLTEKQVKLLEATRFSVSEVSLERVPTSLTEALKTDDREKQLQFRSGGGMTAMFHGHRYDGSENKEDLKRYFNIVDRGIEPLLKRYPGPVVLAGVEYYFPLYREVANIPGLIEGGVKGNTDVIRDDELHKAAWDVVYPVFKRAQADAIARYKQLEGTGQTTHGIEATATAALQGKVESLFIDTELEIWGKFDEAEQKIIVSQTQQPDDIELINETALAVLATGGRVFTMKSEEIPNGGPVAAVLRYAG